MHNRRVGTRSAISLAISSPYALGQELPLPPYGPTDDIGAANLMSATSTLEPVKLVKTGKSYPLGVPIDKNLSAFRHRSFRLTNTRPGEAGEATCGPNKFTFNDELVAGWTGVGTQPSHFRLRGIRLLPPILDTCYGAWSSRARKSAASLVIK